MGGILLHKSCFRGDLVSISIPYKTRFGAQEASFLFDLYLGASWLHLHLSPLSPYHVIPMKEIVSSP